MELIFERSRPGRSISILPPLDVPPAKIPESAVRKTPLRLPQVSEPDISRHYTALAQQTFGVNCGFYPLGSCTMKYNPKLCDELAALPGFTDIHPLQPAGTVRGALQVLAQAEALLCEITGMDAMTMQPAAGAHGEFTGMLLIKAYHAARGDSARTRVLIPDAAHGTNPATAAMAGFETVTIPSNQDGCVDLEALRAAAGADTAALMLTNPNTLGVFDPNILEITRIVHEAGGLNYYDGANLNAVMGVVRPGDMGFDVVHLNLHKTFASPHGGGGPGAGPVGCKAALREFLPEGPGEPPAHTIGRVKAFYGNFLVVVRALTYLLTLGGDGVREAAQTAVLNANYMKRLLSDVCEAVPGGPCMHEFVLSLEALKRECGVSALDVAKALLDHSMHPPTMYFPLIVKEALMFEPTETESKETMDAAVQALRALLETARTNPQQLRAAPCTTPIGRPDEVLAARKPKLKFEDWGPEA